MDDAPKVTQPAHPGADKTPDKAPPAAPRQAAVQFGPTPSIPGSRLKRPGK